MALETGIILGIGILMFFFAYNAYKLTERGNETHQSIGLFLLLISFVSSIVLAASLTTFASDAPLSDAIRNILSNNYQLVIVTFIIVILYFILRVMVLPMIAASKKKNFKIE